MGELRPAFEKVAASLHAGGLRSGEDESRAGDATAGEVEPHRGGPGAISVRERRRRRARANSSWPSKYEAKRCTKPGNGHGQGGLPIAGFVRSFRPHQHRKEVIP